MQSSGLVFALALGPGPALGTNVDLIPDFTAPRVLLIVLTLTAGTAFVMWLGELITQRGIGQGMSIIIFANVVATIPSRATSSRRTSRHAVLVIIGLVCRAHRRDRVHGLGQRRIPVTFASRVQGRRMYGGQSTYIPLKVNQAGVIPIIFASSLLYIPVLVSTVLPWAGVRSVDHGEPRSPTGGVYLVLYGLFIVAFTFFYVHVSFDPHPAGGPDPQTGRIHPRHPTGTADRELSRRRS